MNIKLIGGIIIFVLLALAIVFYTYPKSESEIRSEIEKANYCNVDSDCVDAGGKCPFDCWIYVNKNEVGRIAGLVESFESDCVYSCLACPTAACENNKCKPVCQ